MSADGKQGGGRPICGFVALLVTMSCGAINDNLLRGALLLSVVQGGMWGGSLGAGGTGWVTTMLYLPFILLLGVSGQVADRYPKRRIIVWTRVVEIALAAGVTAAFALKSLPLTCAFFVLLAAQSAFFSPAKYGSVPELVSDRNLSRANGVLSMLTNMAIILGVAAAGLLLEIGPVSLGLTMVVVAAVSLVSSLFIPNGRAADPSLRVSPRTFTAHVRVLKRMRGADPPEMELDAGPAVSALLAGERLEQPVPSRWRSRILHRHLEHERAERIQLQGLGRRRAQHLSIGRPRRR